jgi:ribosomal protein L3 glutamine methyltransferase
VVIDLFRRRIEERVPAAYLTGRAWFAGLEFVVDERVLVPRSPIAELVESGFEPWLDPSSVENVLDLCAGSGCIGIACALAFPDARVDLADVSGEALEVARANIDRHGVGDRVRAIVSDVYDGLGDRRYDLVVSNPPYVDAGELAAMAPEYRHEPELGLAAGPDGLDVVHRILAGAREHLTQGGQLVVEVGASEAALAAAYEHLPLTWVEFERGGGGVFVLSASDLEV